MEWDLSVLYASMDDPMIQEDLEALKEKVGEWNALIDVICLDDQEAPRKLEEALKLESETLLLAQKLGGYVSLVSSADTQNEKAVKYEDLIDQILNDSVESSTRFENWLSHLPDLDRVLNSTPYLSEHAFVLKEMQMQEKYRLSSREEALVASMRQTGSSAFARLKDQIIGNMKVDLELNGKAEKLPLTMVLNLAYDPDPVTRKKAYEAEIAAYQDTEDGLAACLNAIKGEVLTVSKWRGYESVLDETLLDSRMDRETLETMLEAIRESLPHFRAYMKAKAEALGHTNGLPFYDLYAPVTQTTERYTYQEAGQLIVEQFAGFDQEMADMAQRAIDEHWIDVYPRAGKVGGAFCANLPSVKQSRVLMNFGASFDSIVTMAHELGHAFHNLCSQNESILNLNSPMPLAETASTFNETLVKKAALASMSDEEALAVLEAEVSGCNQVIVDIYSRFLFEDAFFKERANGPLSAKEICHLMEEAQIESYGDGLDPHYRHPYMWTWKPHYYYATANYYNFPYAFGQLFAKGLYAMYVKEGPAFVSKYKQLLASTGKMSVYDVAKSIGINIHDIDFWRSSLKMIEEDIDTLIEKLSHR